MFLIARLYYFTMEHIFSLQKAQPKRPIELYEKVKKYSEP